MDNSMIIKSINDIKQGSILFQIDKTSDNIISIEYVIFIGNKNVCLFDIFLSYKSSYKNRTYFINKIIFSNIYINNNHGWVYHYV